MQQAHYLPSTLGTLDGKSDKANQDCLVRHQLPEVWAYEVVGMSCTALLLPGFVG
jgi:hypothetical protein